MTHTYSKKVMRGGLTGYRHVRCVFRTLCGVGTFIRGILFIRLILLTLCVLLLYLLCLPFSDYFFNLLTSAKKSSPSQKSHSKATSASSDGHTPSSTPVAALATTPAATPTTLADWKRLESLLDPKKGEICRKIDNGENY